MRIVAGEWKGRRIQAPAGDRVRPTADRVREAWMSILRDELVDARVLDLFAGSGALGLEAVSRGAAAADLVENAVVSLRVIQANVELLGAGERVAVHRADALKFIGPLGELAYDVAFCDPPYRTGQAQAVAERWLASPFAATLSIEHERADTMPGTPDQRRYGSTVLSFYRA